MREFFPVMDTILYLLRRHGITDNCATLMFMPKKIQDRYMNGSRFGVHLAYSLEERAFGTAGSVKATGDFPNDTFIVISGDCINDFDLGAAIRFHKGL